MRGKFAAIRKAEMDRLLSVLDVVRTGRARIVQLVGEPGSGKSTLLSWLAEQAGQRDMAVVSWRCDGREQGVPLGSVSNLLDLGTAFRSSPAVLVPSTAGEIRELLEERASTGLALLLDD